jgi:hypothetical protein
VRVLAYVYVYGCTRTGVCLRACSLTNPACKALPYCHLRVCGSTTFFDLILLRARFYEKKLLDIKCVLIFSTTCI